MKTATAILMMSGALMIASPALVSRLHPQRYDSGGGNEIARAAIQNRGAIGFIFGQVRTSVSDMMFMKTELYLHSGVRYEPHIDVEALESGGNVEAVKKKFPDGVITGGDHDEHDHHEAPATIIPPADKDFRGFIGDLEREIKPWRPPGSPDVHTAGEELLPWYRMMTLADPNSIRGYMIGAWWLMRDQTEKNDREALTYLDEGVANNPDSFQLWLMKGRAHQRLKQTDEALKAWDTARKLAIERRPEGGKVTDDWTDYMEDDFRAAISAQVFTLRDLGRIDEAVHVARETLKTIPEFEPLQKFVHEVKEGKFTTKQ
ncbi:hypothetical protein IT570_06825 [Candidatus Sumerlaeota bacterium]|nr:hypothetical protein [Candidatus Sumerlaeota bacterium]